MIVIFGPTAVGKTELIEKILNSRFEIINADSLQVYKYLDIGTAKPDKGLLKKVKHHLIDIVEPDVQYNVGDFVKSADRIVVDIWERGKVPVVSGGTAFYLKHFVLGLPETPPVNREIRERLGMELKEKGLKALYGSLMSIDPITAERVGINDKYRIIRALEVFYATGKPLSRFSLPERARGDFKFLLIGLLREREELYRRIEERVDAMFERGLLSEIKKLLAMGYSFDDPGFKGIGYREFREFSKGCITLNDVRDMIKRNSRRYAKRQITFMKKLEGVKWFSPTDEVAIREEIEKFIGEMEISS